MLKVNIHRQNDFPINIQFACDLGELHVLVGPSGSGKTTALRSLAGLSDVSGLIQCQDQVWLDTTQKICVPTEKRSVGFLFQQYALFPHLTVLENVCIPLIARQVSSSDEGHRWLKRLRIADLANRYPHEISGGQQQRVALARALARDPKLLLLDEPFSAVDAPTRQNLYEALSELRQAVSLPIILVTHDLNEAIRLGDKITVIDNGVSLQTSAPQQLLDKPRNARVAELVGSPNLFRGIFESGVLSWGQAGLKLFVKDKGKIKKPTDVAWVIPSHSIEVINSDQDTHSYKNNLIDCEVIRVRQLGQIAVIYWQVKGCDDQIVWQASSNELKRLGITVGAHKKIYLDPDQIHIMPINPELIK
ncbi:MAG: ABC transporter ATP-binding protein [Polynucleobacter victoriensis]